MTPGMVAAWVVGLLTLLVAGITLSALILAPTDRHRRPQPFQHPALPPMDDSDVDGDHDWDGWLWELTAAEPKPTLREESIHVTDEEEPS